MRALYCTRKVIWAVPVQLDARNKNLPFMRALYCTRKVTPATPIPPDARKCYFFLYLCTACRLQKAPETRCSSRTLIVFSLRQSVRRPALRIHPPLVQTSHLPGKISHNGFIPPPPPPPPSLHGCFGSGSYS